MTLSPPEVDSALPSTLVAVDGGARGGLRDLRRLHSMIDLHAFEPDPAACEALRSLAGYRSVHPVPLALADRAGRRVLHLARRRSMSSLLEPDLEAYEKHFGRMADYPSWARAIETVARVDVDAVALDEWAGTAGVAFVHFLKLDTQGTELDVLRGATGLLAEGRVCVIRTEVSFLPVYRAQALFPTVDRHLADTGYQFIDCSVYPDRVGAPRWPTGRYVEPPRWSAGGDATYACVPTRWAEDVRVPRTVATALILSHLGYGRTAALWLRRHAGWRDDQIEAILASWTRRSWRERWAARARRWLPPAFSNG